MYFARNLKGKKKHFQTIQKCKKYEMTRCQRQIKGSERRNLVFSFFYFGRERGE